MTAEGEKVAGAELGVVELMLMRMRRDFLPSWCGRGDVAECSLGGRGSPPF